LLLLLLRQSVLRLRLRGLPILRLGLRRRLSVLLRRRLPVLGLRLWRLPTLGRLRRGLPVGLLRWLLPVLRLLRRRLSVALLSIALLWRVTVAGRGTALAGGLIHPHESNEDPRAEQSLARMPEARFSFDAVDPRTATRKFNVAPCVMLVALAEAEAEVCARVLKPLTAGRSVAIMRVAHIKAACERMLVTRPLVVIFAEALGVDDRKLLTERAEDISSAIVTLSAHLDEAELRVRLFEAFQRAEQG
jgi:hypothetical protein